MFFLSTTNIVIITISQHKLVELDDCCAKKIEKWGQKHKWGSNEQISG